MKIESFSCTDHSKGVIVNIITNKSLHNLTFEEISNCEGYGELVRYLENKPSNLQEFLAILVDLQYNLGLVKGALFTEFLTQKEFAEKGQQFYRSYVEKDDSIVFHRGFYIGWRNTDISPFL